MPDPMLDLVLSILEGLSMMFSDCGLSLDVRTSSEVCDRLGKRFSEYDGLTSDEISRKAARSQFLGAFSEVRSYGINLIPLPRIGALLDKELIAEFDSAVMSRGLMVPLSKTDKHLSIAIADTINSVGIDYCRQTYPDLTLQIFITHASEIGAVVDKLIGGAPIDAENIQTDAVSEDEFRSREFNLTEETSSEIGELVRKIMLDAVTKGSSDIHFKVEATRFYYKFRIDGDCTSPFELPKKLAGSIDTFLMVTAGLPLDARIAPSSGRFSLLLQGRKIDVRYERHPVCGSGSSRLSSFHITMRLLDKSNVELTLGRGSLVFDPRVTACLQKIIRLDSGMIMISGPTGSGKSSTVTAILKELNREKYNILTLENPVEEVIPGVTHVQIDTANTDVFKTYMASFMRSDPDIIFIGEVRDLASAQAALSASTTGHQVISTVHSARGSMIISRLVNLGLERYDIGENLRACCSQRLVRTLCRNCSEEYELTSEMAEVGGIPKSWVGKTLRRHSPEGCPNCINGYKGRRPLFEILPITFELSSLLCERNVPAFEIEKNISESTGLPLMRDLALCAIEDGSTDIDAIQDVVSMTF